MPFSVFTIGAPGLFNWAKQAVINIITINAIEVNFFM